MDIRSKIEELILIIILVIAAMNGVIAYYLLENNNSKNLRISYLENMIVTLDIVANNKISNNIKQCHSVVNKTKEVYDKHIQNLSNNHASEMLNIWSTSKKYEDDRKQCNSKYNEMRKMYNFCVQEYKKCKKTEPI